MCKFEDPNELERKKYLDERLNMNREAENLYKEITKFIFQNESDFIDRKLLMIKYIFDYYLFIRYFINYFFFYLQYFINNS